MSLTPGPELVGQKVCNAARLDWGVGQVLRVQKMGEAWRVSVQFHSGHRFLMVPPARLVRPQTEEQRSSDWLATAAGVTLDSRLTQLPEDIRFFLGLPLQKFVAMLPLYEPVDDPRALESWARRQTGISQPLSQWTRDELMQAHAQFCVQRDLVMRETLERLFRSGNISDAQDVLSAAPAHVQAAVREAAPKL